MSLFKVIKSMTGMSKDAPKVGVDRDDHPLDMHPGSLITFNDLDIVLAQADGSVVPAIESNQTVIKVGRQKLFDLDVYHSYLSNVNCFVRTVADKNTVKEVSLFVLRDIIEPQNAEEWAFWLGTYQQGTLTEYGLIGWPQFQIDNPSIIVYDRAWKPSLDGIQPIKYVENIVTNEGKFLTVNREAMEYNRKLNDTTYESLFVSLVQCGNDASVEVHVGIPLNPANIKVLAV